MKYYVIYNSFIGVNIYSEEELEYMDTEDSVIEYYGELQECIDYMERNI